MHFIVCLLCFLPALASAIPTYKVVIGDQTRQAEQVKNWLTKYGYIETPSVHSKNKNSALREAVLRMQSFHNFPQTGDIDYEILKMMKMPRCGFPDTTDGIARFHTYQLKGKSSTEERTRHRRYLLSRSKWNKTVITYKFNNFSPDLSTAMQRDSFQKAVDEWTTVTNLYMTEGTSSATSDVQIRFAVGVHEDSNKFDGRGGTLAHAYFPGQADFGGDIHFDDDEDFSTDDVSGVDFYFVALHELGHSLGLDHSSNPRSIMSPIYRGFSKRLKLHKDDITAIQTLYGVKVGYNPSPDVQSGTVVVEVDDGHSPCTVTYDAIVNTGDNVYFFKDELVWQTDLDYRPGPYATTINNLWTGGPASVDAAFMKPDHSVVLLFNDSRWEFYPNSFRLKPGFPKTNEDLGSFPSSVDAAVFVGLFNIILVFKGDLYWTLDPSTLLVQAKGVSVASLGLPSPMNAAFANNDKLFFLTGTTDYYAYDATSFRALPGYPKNFNIDIAEELCGWCQTFKNKDVTASPTAPKNSSPRNTADLITLVLLFTCYSLLSGYQ